MGTKVLLLFTGIAVLLLGASLRYVRSGTAIVVYRLEERHRWRGPGLRWVIPGLERSVPCSIEPEAWWGDVRCYAADRTEMSVRVSLQYEVIDAVRFDGVVHLIDHRIADVVSLETAALIAQLPVQLVIGQPGSISSEIEHRVGQALLPVGVRLLSLQTRAPRVSASMSDALGSEIEATYRRPAQLIAAETAVYSRLLEMQAELSEFSEMLGIASEMSEQALRLYESRTQRVAAARGNVVTVVGAPALPPPAEPARIHAPNVTSMGAWRGKDGFPGPVDQAYVGRRPRT
ncbi:MAG: SPFH domain-containing protein [Acidimicrobiia bacterium]